MPIKFRCPHCDQLLGISRTKAKAVVDCPTCGRQLRVPDLDNRVSPIPDPELDLQDAQLADALRELASIPDGAGEETADAPASAARRQRPHVIALPLKEHPSPSAKTVTGKTPTLRDAVSADEPASDSDPLASLVDEAIFVDSDDPPRPWWAHPAVLAAGVLLLSGCFFGLGYYVRGWREPAPPAETLANRDQNALQAVKGVDAGGWKKALQGNISYRTDNGNLRPDRGARIIALPHEREGDVRLSIVGFRSGDTEADVAVARAGLRALGGDLAVADADGLFRIFLPEAGNYHIITISRFQPAPPNKVPSPTLMKLLTRDFDRPEQLLGHTHYHSADLPYRGEETQDWDYVFANASEK